ncbi:GTPase IMAP family member 4-like isoform X2 [Girardinichthys multiradiatus]|uniref:GTPase IMAP family member 4-like isoform X2 n=1 Tax=Girardinichthys multiradiatus TaxID=208333 RepID=UPI001FAD6410|nr:GTPase IMAP family member 4-like isoform X2 [Girardinichthys multiradiatus]
MECQCENNAEAASAGWFLSGSNVQMGAFTMVGYLLYRFSQTLPALIRWPIRFFCYITGLSALWGWVSRLVGTLRGIKNLLKWLSRIWQFLVGSPGDGSQISGTSEKLDLRLILLGPSGRGRTFIADTLLGNNKTRASMDPLKQSTKWSTVVDSRTITVIDTPDILGPSLGNTSRAREALRSLQLTSPGPHAFLLVIQAPGSGMSLDQDPTQAIQGTLELFGEGVTGYIIPVLTHADILGRRRTVDHVLEADSGELKRALSLCGQRPELVDNRLDLPPEAQTDLCRHFVERVMEMKELRGHFVHEVHRRQDYLREKLLYDMSSALAEKLGQK